MSDAAFIKEATKALLVEILDDDCDDLQSVRAIARTLRAAGQVIPEPPDANVEFLRLTAKETRDWLGGDCTGEPPRTSIALLAALAEAVGASPPVEVGVTVEATELQKLAAMFDAAAGTWFVPGYDGRRLANLMRSLQSTPTFVQPDWTHVFHAFVEGAREARSNPDATDPDFKRAADGWTKRVHEGVDPETERRLRENDWPPLPAPVEPTAVIHNKTGRLHRTVPAGEVVNLDSWELRECSVKPLNTNGPAHALGFSVEAALRSWREDGRLTPFEVDALQIGLDRLRAALNLKRPA